MTTTDQLVVRKQLTAAVGRKEAQLRRLDRQIEQAQKDIDAQKAHRDAVNVELLALNNHLGSLGGPVKKEKK